MTTTNKVDFKKPRQKMWGIVKANSLVSLPYGNETDTNGALISSYYTNCYPDLLQQAHELLAAGTAVTDMQLVEFVPYDFSMTPTV